MPSNQSISVVIICFNEEANMENCLKSVQEIADEIIIVDSYSTDKTIEICKNYNCIIYQREWEGYSKAKNFGNAQSKSNYILSLDSDEVLSQELIQSLQKAKAEKLDANYSLQRITNYCGRWIKNAGWYPDIKLRLFPRGQAEWVGDHVHETLSCNNSLQKLVLDGHLLHYSYKSADEHRLKDKRYAELAAMRDINKKNSIVQAYLSASIQFIKMYVFKLGFLEGRLGLQLCMISAISKIHKYKYWKKLQA